MTEVITRPPLAALGADALSTARAAITRTDLAAAFAFASLGLSSRPVVPVLGGMLVTVTPAGVELAAFDYETAAKAAVPCATYGTGSVLVAGAMLAAAVKSLPRGRKVTAELAVTADGLTITSEGMETVLPPLPREEYPQLPAIPEASGTADGEAFTRAVKRVAAGGAGTDDTLPALTCVCVTSEAGTLELAATDRYRLAVDRIGWTGPDGANALIPAAVLAKAAAKMDAAGKITLHLGEDHAGISDGTRTLVTRLNLGTFPKYRSFLRDGEHDAAVTVDAARLAAAVTRAGKMTERGVPVHLVAGAGDITVKAYSDGACTASEGIPATVDGPELTAGFNAAYLASVLKGFAGDVRIGLKTRTIETAPDADGVRREFVTTYVPAQITADGETFTAICMPIRIQEAPAEARSEPEPQPEAAQDIAEPEAAPEPQPEPEAAVSAPESAPEPVPAVAEP